MMHQARRPDHDCSTADDLGAVFDAHVKAEFVIHGRRRHDGHDAEPTRPCSDLTGGTGRAQVERFYRDNFVGHWPDVFRWERCRTSGQNRVIDEVVVKLHP